MVCFAAAFGVGSRAPRNHVSFFRPDAAGGERRDRGDVFGRWGRRSAGGAGRGAGEAGAGQAVSRPVFFLARRHDDGRHGRQLRFRAGRVRHVPFKAARDASFGNAQRAFDRCRFASPRRIVRRRAPKSADGTGCRPAFRLFPARFRRSAGELYRKFDAEFFGGIAVDALPRYPARMAAGDFERRNARGRDHADADAGNRDVSEVFAAGAGGGARRAVEGLCDGRESAGRGGQCDPDEKRAAVVADDDRDAARAFRRFALGRHRLRRDDLHVGRRREIGGGRDHDARLSADPGLCGLDGDYLCQRESRCRPFVPCARSADEAWDGR